MDPHIFTSLILLLCISCFVSGIAKWLKQPYTIALVLTGLVVAILKVTPSISISHDVTFMMILPPLLFHGAMHMDMEQLKINWKSIGMLAIPGVVVSTLIIGWIVHIVLGIDLTSALLFGALISPTDPISVLAILKKVGAPKRLRSLLEGESLFNDGTGVVIFLLVLGILSGAPYFFVGHTFIEFLKITGGGTLIGLVIGGVFYHALKQINDPLHETAMTIVLAFGTPIVAELFHFSGIIAVVVAGMIIGNYGKHYSMTQNTCDTLDSFWEVIDFVINSILFLVIGIELQVVGLLELAVLWQPIGIVILAVLAARMLVVYPIVWIKNAISEDHRDIPKGWEHVLFWGGLKGSISIALVVGLPQGFAHRELFLTLAFSVVLFTLVIQGLTMKPLINKLGLSHEE